MVSRTGIRRGMDLFQGYSWVKFPFYLVASLWLISLPAVAQDYAGVWWDPTRSGQGVTLAQQGSTLSGAWYLYDESGNGLWVTFIGDLNGNSVTADLLRFTGPALGTPWDSGQVVSEPIGGVTITFASAGSATFAYSVNGINGTLNLVPFSLAGGNEGALGGVWWDQTRSGQGVTLAHEGDTLSGAWYLYDETGNGLWVTFIGEFTGDSMTVDLLRFTGPELGDPWDPALVSATPVGEMTLISPSADFMRFDYTINGVDGYLSLLRFGESSGGCADVAGTWTGTESAIVSCVAEDEVITDTLSSEGTAVFEQDGCLVSYTVPGFDVTRSGVIDGDRLYLSGPFIVIADGGVQLTQNTMVLAGTLSGDQLSLSGVGWAQGTVDGTSASCTGDSNVQFTRQDPGGDDPPCLDIAGLYTGTFEETYCDGETYMGSFGLAVDASCSYQLVTESLLLNGVVSDDRIEINAVDPECGVVSGSATVGGGSVSGSYSYGAGGGGRISGTRQ